MLSKAAPRSVVIVALALGCSDGGGGDLELVPPQPPSAVGNGSRLAELNAPDNQRTGDVSVTGISVVAVDSFDETSDGSAAGNIYAQDLATEGASPPYGGITLFDPSFSPPSLRVAPGDVIDARGSYEEFPGPSSFPFPEGETLPELVGASVTLRFEYAVPEPVDIPISDLGSYQTGRQWLGMLVRVSNVSAAGDSEISSGRFKLPLAVTSGNAPYLSNALFDLPSSGKPLTATSKYKSIVGIVQYFFDFTIAPRSAEDIVPEGQ